jgi:small subunit ribosomal protein S24e
MEIDIIEKKENKLLNRNEVKFACVYEGESTPKILEVKSKLVALLNTKKDLIVVDSIQPHFGEAKAAGYAKVYDSKKHLKDIETDHILEKNKEAETAPEDDDGSDETSKNNEEEE